MLLAANNKKTVKDKDIDGRRASYCVKGEDIAKDWSDVDENYGAGKAQRMANKTRLCRELGQLR